jgi:spermidine synthase
MAKFFLGDRTLAVTTLLVAYITCLGLGSLVARVVGDDRGDTTVKRGLTIAAWTLLISAVLHVLFVPLAAWAIKFQGFAFLNSIFPQYFKRIICLFLFIGPPTLVLGIVFPLLARNSGSVVNEPGRTLGDLYFVNTIGAAVGAAFACFALSRLWGTIGGFFAITGLIVTVASVFLVRLHRNLGTRAVVGLIVGVFVAGGVWTPKNLWPVSDGEILISSTEDEYGVHVLVETSNGGARIRNNRIQLIATLGEPMTTHAQQMMAHLPALLARDCKTTLNLGTGYGITPGALTLYDSVESIETVELLPFVLALQDRFVEHNFAYFRDPRTRTMQGDGRYYLFSTERTYDVICANVLDPYLPGSASLYTVEFWEEARKHLRPGGVYNQLIWGAHVPLIVKGLESVFPTVIYFDAYGGGAFNVIAFRDGVSKERLSIHWDRLVPKAREEFVRISQGATPETYLPLQIEKAWAVRKVLRQRASKIKQLPHSDNHPTLEYVWAHGIKHVTVLDTPMVDY